MAICVVSSNVIIHIILYYKKLVHIGVIVLVSSLNNKLD